MVRFKKILDDETLFQSGNVQSVKYPFLLQHFTMVLL